MHLVNRGPFSTLSNLERTIVVLWVSKPLLPCVESVFLIVNGYALAGGRQEQLRIREEGPAPAWLETLTEDEAKVPWVTVLQRVHDPGRPPGVYDLVREWLEKIDGLEESIKQDPEFRRSWRFQQAWIALRDSQPERALVLLEEALVCARQTNIPAYIEETESAIAQIRRSLGQTEDTLPQLEQAYQASKDRQDRYLVTRAYELAQALAVKGRVGKSLGAV